MIGRTRGSRLSKSKASGSNTRTSSSTVSGNPPATVTTPVRWQGQGTRVPDHRPVHLSSPARLHLNVGIISHHRPPARETILTGDAHQPPENRHSKVVYQQQKLRTPRSLRMARGRWQKPRSQTRQPKNARFEDFPPDHVHACRAASLVKPQRARSA